MTAHSAWRKAKNSWRRGEIADHTMLSAASLYLQESADWIDIRDFFISMSWTKDEALDWFSDEDFPDFADAVEEGWGWPALKNPVLCET
jgi:hypothetical protein